MSEPWADGPMVAFDLETTGVDPESDRIVTACVIEVGPSGVVSRRGWLADPGVEIPDSAAAIHGITTERARTEGRPVADVAAEISTALGDAWSRGLPVVIYNAPYDLTLLGCELLRHTGAGLTSIGPVVDPLVIDRGVDLYRRGSRKLIDVCRHYRISLPEVEAHTSAGDALAVVRLAWRLARVHPEIRGLSALQGLQRSRHSAWAENFEEYLSRQGKSESISREWPVRRLAVQAMT